MISHKNDISEKNVNDVFNRVGATEGLEVLFKLEEM